MKCYQGSNGVNVTVNSYIRFKTIADNRSSICEVIVRIPIAQHIHLIQPTTLMISLWWNYYKS